MVQTIEWCDSLTFEESEGEDSLDVEGVVTDWSPDGRTLLLRRNDQDTDFDIMLFDFESKEIRPLVISPFKETGGKFSPDGRWVAYFSYEAGQPQIYIVSVSGVGGKYQASIQGGAHPAWNPAGGELFYLSTTGELMKVDVVERDGLVIGTPQALFKVNHPLTSNEKPYVVAPDGQSFLVNQHEDRNLEAYVNLIQNWTRLLER